MGTWNDVGEGEVLEEDGGAVQQNNIACYCFATALLEHTKYAILILLFLRENVESIHMV